MIAVAILFIIFGVLIKHGKMYFLLAGYNTMSKEEKSKHDIVGITSLFRNVMFGMALIIIIAYYIRKSMENPNVATISIVVAVALGIPYLLIKSNSNKYKINKQ